MRKRHFDPSDLQYLQRIGSHWHARVPVPNPLRPRLGPYLRRTLETSDLWEAQRRRRDVVMWARTRFAVRPMPLLLAATLPSCPGSMLDAPYVPLVVPGIG
jgi:hypothetical protein